MRRIMNEPNAILDGRDHFAFIPCGGKPYLWPKAVQRLNPNNDNASSKWIVRLKWLTEGRSTNPLATMAQPAKACRMKTDPMAKYMPNSFQGIVFRKRK